MTRSRIRTQRGAGGIGCLLVILLVAAGIYGGLQIILPQLRHNSFDERIGESFVFFTGQPAESIRARIIDIAREFDIPLDRKQVKVTIDPGKVTIDIAYEKHVDLKVWEKTFRFSVQRFGPY